MGYLRARIQDEQGIAIVTALLISMIVVTLGATSVAMAIHNSEASAFDRRRVQSIAAAEAGVNYYFSHLQSGGAEDFECAISQTLSSTPAARFDATVTFYDASQIPLACPPGATEPASALIRSVGTASNDKPARTMEAYVRLVPIPGSPFGEFAIFSEGDPEFNANVQVFGGEAVEGNVYTNGNVIIESNSVIHGSVEAQGSVVLGSNAQVRRDVIAGSSVQMESNATVLQSITSANSSILMDSNAHVFGDATAATTVTLNGNSEVDGIVASSVPSDPPEAQTFPQFEFDAGAWLEAGYTIQTFASCLDAKAFIAGITGGDHVVRIAAPCELSYSSNEVATVRGNLAIVADGGLRMNSNTQFLNEGDDHNLFLLFGLGGTGTTCDIDFGSNTRVADGLKSVLYTPCTIDMRSNALVLEGQMVGGSVEFNSNASLSYEPIGVPGFGSAGFDEDILYMREVITEGLIS
jgi:cytoskeletal protein CcmA (bactofilin family)